MNKLSRNVTLVAFALSTVALGATTAAARAPMYPWELHAPVVTHSSVDGRRLNTGQTQEHSTIARNPQECVPGSYWLMYRPNGGSIPIACGATLSSR